MATNNTQSLSDALKRLDDITGYGTAHSAKLTDTRVRGYTTRTASSVGEIESIASPFSSALSGGMSSAIDGNGFTISQGQFYSDLSASLTRAAKRNL